MMEKDFIGLGIVNLLVKDGLWLVYCKDFGLNDIVYYEIFSGDGKEYFFLFVGFKIGDNWFVESG